MRVALFATGGEIPVCALRALSGVAEVAMVVRPGRAPGLVRWLRGTLGRLRGRPSDAVSDLAHELRVPEQRMRGPADRRIAEVIRRSAVDLVCVATFPWRLRLDVLEAAPGGAVNVHASLLPRHRGPNPWFWIYHADDRTTGVSVHRCVERIDAGDILGRREWSLARGYPVRSLHHDVAERGGELLAEVVASLAQGKQPAAPQDETSATRAPRLTPGASMVDYSWPAERVWHLLAGTAGQFREPLRCAGQAVAYRGVPGFTETTPAAAPGTVEQVTRGWRLWCRDGFVSLLNGDA